MAKYTPQGIPVTRVEKMLRDVIKECDQDRELALEQITELKQLLAIDPDNGQARMLMNKALDTLQSTKTHKTKALDTLTKIKLKEMDIQSKDTSSDPEKPQSFEDFIND